MQTPWLIQMHTNIPLPSHAHIHTPHTLGHNRLCFSTDYSILLSLLPLPILCWIRWPIIPNYDLHSYGSVFIKIGLATARAAGPASLVLHCLWNGLVIIMLCTFMLSFCFHGPTIAHTEFNKSSLSFEHTCNLMQQHCIFVTVTMHTGLVWIRLLCHWQHISTETFVQLHWVHMNIVN